MMLSEISQTPKDKCSLSPFTGGPRDITIQRQRKVVIRAWGQGTGGFDFNGYSFRLGRWKCSGDEWWQLPHNISN